MAVSTADVAMLVTSVVHTSNMLPDGTWLQEATRSIADLVRSLPTLLQTGYIAASSYQGCSLARLEAVVQMLTAGSTTCSTRQLRPRVCLVAKPHEAQRHRKRHMGYQTSLRASAGPYAGKEVPVLASEPSQDDQAEVVSLWWPEQPRTEFA